jgi:hypothetical protein
LKTPSYGAGRPPLKIISESVHPDKYVSILSTCRDKIIQDFRGAVEKINRYASPEERDLRPAGRQRHKEHQLAPSLPRRGMGEVFMASLQLEENY